MKKSVGNFELCVAVGGKVQHWWRANGSDGLWRNSAMFAHDVQAVVSLVEGSYGFNLEVIVLRTDNKLQHLLARRGRLARRTSIWKHLKSPCNPDKSTE